MTKQEEIIEGLAKEALLEANAKHEEKFNSVWEAYGVFKEEFEEVQEDLDQAKVEFNNFWKNIRTEDYDLLDYDITNIEFHVTNMIKEGLQVLAMCMKFNLSFKDPISETLEERQLKKDATFKLY